MKIVVIALELHLLNGKIKEVVETTWLVTGKTLEISAWKRTMLGAGLLLSRPIAPAYGEGIEKLGKEFTIRRPVRWPRFLP